MPRLTRDDFLAALAGAGQGATFDFGDEIYGAGRGAYDAITGRESIADAYQRYRDQARGEIKRLEEASPNAYMAGDIASAFVPGVGQAGVAAKVSKPLLKRALQMAVMGGAGGLGRSEADNAVDMAKDTLSSAAMSAGTGVGMDQFMRRVGDVIDFKKMRDKLKKDKVTGSGGGDDSWFTDKIDRLSGEKRKRSKEEVHADMQRKIEEKRRKPGLTGDLGKPDAATRAENNRRAMEESGLDRGERKSAADIQKIDSDLNIARNKVDLEHTKFRNAPDYGENTYMNHGAFKEVPPGQEMDFISFAKAIEKGHKYHPEDAMKPLERDRWDIFRAQANMAKASEDAEKLERLAGRFKDDDEIRSLIDDVKKNGERWKASSEIWSDDLSDMQKRIDAGEKIPGYTHTPSFDDEADDFAKRAMEDDSRFPSFDDARAWYVKNWGPEAVAKKAETRAKKEKNETLERMFRASDEYKKGKIVARGDDEVTWPRRDISELPGEAKFTRGNNNKLTSVSDGPGDWESYAQALERGDKVKNPLATLDEKELEKFQLFASQAKALDQLDYADALEARTKKGGDLYDIKKRKIVTDIIKNLRKEAGRGLSSGWGNRRDPWNEE